jgi:hypothetical protein
MPEPDRVISTLNSSDARALTRARASRCAHRQQTAPATPMSAIRNFAFVAAIGIAALGKALVSQIGRKIYVMSHTFDAAGFE